MTDLWSYLKTAKKPIVLYGTGNGADKVLSRLSADGVAISGVFSSDGFKKNKLFGGHTVCSFDELAAKLGDMIILVCFGSDRAEVIENIRRLSETQELYVPDVPVYGQEIFDLAFARQNAEDIRAVYDMLADDFSKKVFENTVYFKLTGNPRYLYEIESDPQEGLGLLGLCENEVFLDLGAFTGDTVAEFINATDSYSKIIAVEPDRRNFRKLTENTADLKNITLTNAAVGESLGSILMSSQHGRGIGGTAKAVEIDCTTIDEICKNTAPTYIKMDVEGSELAAISGGLHTITTHKPTLKIACYHRSQDIFSLPLKIKEAVPDYRVYMRHLPCLPAWDTDFVFKIIRNEK